MKYELSVYVRGIYIHSQSKQEILLYWKGKNQIIAVCIYRLVMINIDLTETAHFGYCQSETKSETIFF